MIYTSYFPMTKYVSNPISIARISPKWFVGGEYKLLAPSMTLLMNFKNGLIDKRIYVERYVNEIVDNGFTIDKFRNDIPDKSTLMCWELPLDFCHRHIVAYILRKNGIDVMEWINE